MAQPDIASITVEVAYALPQSQTIISLELKEGTTAQEAVTLSGILQQYPEIAANHLVLGIFGKKIKPDTVLRALDRVEIYRPLLANAKEARRQRAAAKNGKQKPAK